MNTLQNRLRAFVDYLDISMQEFERQCNIKAGTASRMTEKSYSKTFHRIQETFPQLNMDWLKKGEGDMLNSLPSIDIDFKLGGHSQMALRDINNIGDAKAQIAILQERIKSLESQIGEKNKQISTLAGSLDRERKINDYLMSENDKQ